MYTAYRSVWKSVHRAYRYSMKSVHRTYRYSMKSVHRAYRYSMKTTNNIQMCRPEKDTRWRSWLRHSATIWKVLVLILDSVIFPGVDSASNRNEYQGAKGVRCLGTTTLPASCANVLEILGVSTSWSPEGR